MLEGINSVFSPNKVIIQKEPAAKESEISGLTPYSKYMKMINDKPTIYACSNFVCKSPSNEIADVIKLLT